VVAEWLRCCATNWKVAGSVPASVNGFFIDIKFFWLHYGPGVDSASNRNEHQEYFLGGKGGRCVRPITLPPSCAVVTKSGSLNFLETSGPVQACNGTALPLLSYNKHWETFTFQIQLSVPARRNLDFSVSACPVSGWFEASPWSSMVNCAHNMVETTGIPSTCWNHVLYIGTLPRTGLRLQKQKKI